MISFAVLGLGAPAARADSPLIKCTVKANTGYIVPESYATAHKADFVATLPDSPRVDGFWTPSEADANVADRNFRDVLEDAARNPALLFPNLGNTDPDSPDSLPFQRNELVLILGNYSHYLRQYVGVVIENRKYVVCNYVVGPGLDPSAGYLFIQKVFAPGGKIHFLQCRYDYDYRRISHVSFIGPWQQVDNR